MPTPRWRRRLWPSWSHGAPMIAPAIAPTRCAMPSLRGATGSPRKRSRGSTSLSVAISPETGEELGRRETLLLRLGFAFLALNGLGLALAPAARAPDRRRAPL